MFLAKKSINLYKISSNLCQIITINKCIFTLIKTPNLNYWLVMRNQIKVKTKGCIFHKITPYVVFLWKSFERNYHASITRVQGI